MSRTRRSYYSAWLALLSMLLISIAPVISQSLGVVHASGLSELSIQTDYCGQPPDTGHQTSSTLPDDSGGVHESCLYCSLLANLPLLNGGDAAGKPAGPRLLHRLAAVPSDACRTAPTFPHALTRAPPLALSSAYIHAWNVMPEPSHALRPS